MKIENANNFSFALIYLVILLSGFIGYIPGSVAIISVLRPYTELGIFNIDELGDDRCYSPPPRRGDDK